MFCTSCGAEIPDGARFCTSCGAVAAAGDPVASRAGATLPSEAPHVRGRRRQAPGWAVAVAATLALLACGGTVAAFVLLGGFSPIGEEPENQVQVVAEQPGAPDPAPVEESDPGGGTEVESGSSPVAELAPERDAAPDAGSPTGSEPFWGVWIGAYSQSQNAQECAALAHELGFGDARIEFSSDWAELNQAGYYVVSAGTYASQADAESVLSSVRQHFSDAYVKYSGTHK